VLVNSFFSREAVLRGYGRLARVCLPGIDTERFGLQGRPEDVRGNVLSVGALVEGKNPRFLVGAVGAAAPAMARFVWVANYVDERCRQLVEQAAAEVGVSFELRRKVSDNELLQAYAEADVFVYAPRLEPFGLAPLEANATGLPVVAVAEGDVRETIVDGVNGALVDHDHDQFGSALAALLADSTRTRALGRSARDHVIEHWGLPSSIDRLQTHLLMMQLGRPT
jgi:glycosyltransferase involved in cell wall biosynthesis